MNRDVDFPRLLMATHGMAVEDLQGQDLRPVVPTQEALADLRTFDEPLPEGPTEPEAVVAKLHRLGSPGTVVTTGGRYFGFVPGGVLPAALAANWLAGAWDQNAGFWVMSPVSSKLEQAVAGWLLDLLDLPRESAVGFVTGSTMASFSALLAARTAICARHGHDVARRGLREAPPIRVVTSADIHPSNIRALSYLGIGRDEVERVDTDAQGRIHPERLPPLDDRTVLLVQAGNVNSGAFDDFGAVCDRAEEAGAWVHVDGAFGLWARASPSMRKLTEGIERADSWNLDGHKWLNLPMDSGVFVCRDPQAVFHAFAVDAPYMVRSERREPNRFTPELGRRARGIEFWAALKSLGRRGVADLVERSCAYARRYAAELEALSFEILNDVCLNQVLFALDSRERTGAVLALVQESGEVWIGPTEWRGRFAMRISCCAWNMDDTDFDVTMNTIRAALERSEPNARGPEP